LTRLNRRTTAVNYGYDNLGRRVCRHTATCTASTTGAERFTYDAAGNMTSAISISPAPTYNMTYDDDGRPATVSRGAVLETTYTYNPTTALLTSVADAAGTTALTYNAAGQISTLDDPLATTGLSTYSYDATKGRLIQRTDAQANTRVERAYEAATGRLDTQIIKNNTTSAVLASFDLGYDLAGNVSSKASSVFSNPSNGTWTYDYDGASRLIQATGPNATGVSTIRDYAYDGGGNRTLNKETTGSVVSNWTTVYDGAGLPTSATNAVGAETVTYTHDQVGSLTKADSTVAANDWAWTYDAFSRLTCAKQATTCTSGTTRVLTTLDAFDRTYQRTYNGAVTDYTYQGVGELPVKTQVGAGTPTTYALTPGGQPLAEKTGANTYFSLRDPHGDVVGLVTTAAANQGTTAFDPWGKPLGITGTQGWLGYQGDPTDVITRQVDMGTRHYQPSLGRFSSRDVVPGDPLSPMSLNQHAYGVMNPITMWDPTGMAGCNAHDTDTKNCSREVRRELDARVRWSFHDYYVSPPPPEPAPPIAYNVNASTAAREAGSWATAAAGVAASAVTGLGSAITQEGRYIFNSAGAGFINGRAAQSWIARADAKLGSVWARAARSGVFRWGGRGIAGLGGVLTGIDAHSEGYSVPESVAIGAGSAGGGLALAAAGAQIGLGCGPFAWACSPVLAAGGGILGAFGGENLVKSLFKPSAAPPPGLCSRGCSPFSSLPQSEQVAYCSQEGALEVWCR